MLRNYLTIAWRNLFKNKVFSAINIVGLGIGLAASAIILLWVNYEHSFESFHERKDRIYQAWNRTYSKEGINAWNTTPQTMALALQKDYPEVEKVARADWPWKSLVMYKDVKVKGNLTVVDSTFTQIFSFPLLRGDKNTCLKGVNNIVITESLARRLFGDEDPMGKIVRIENQSDMTVSGVMKDLPGNTQFSFEGLIPWNFKVVNKIESLYWGNNSTTTYVLLKEKTNVDAFQNKIKHLRKNYDKETADWETFLYPITRLQLHGSFKNGVETGGRIELVRTFTVVALLILLIACINFMNLSTAKSEKRAKEVGVRKVAGANRFSLVRLFYVESIITALLAGVLAVLIVGLSMPTFNQLLDKKISVEWLNPSFVGASLLVVFLTGILAGSYPAVYLSGFKPIEVLKGNFKKAGASVTPRKILVVSQFTFSVMLIAATIVIRNQVEFAKNRQTGYDRENLVFHFMEGDIERNYALIKNELISQGVALSVVKTFSPVTETWSNTGGMEWKGKASDDERMIDRFSGDDKVAQTLGLQIIEGRDFDLQQYPTDSTAAILNESAAKLMGFKNPIGETVKDGGMTFHVVGVVKDFVINSPYRPVNPIVIAGASLGFNAIHIKYNPAKPIKENLAAAEKIFKKYNPNYPFEFQFVDEAYAKKFSDENRISQLAYLFSFLTIFVSCLGLFGLAAFMAQNRTKEIGIRKVLGASVSQLVLLLSKEFLLLVIISIIIASPVTYWLMEKWLSEYEYRIGISPLVFVYAGSLTVLTALLTVSYQAIKASLTNPAKSLRTE